MTGLLVLLILFALFLIITINNRTGEHQKSLDQLNQKISSLSDKIELLSKSGSTISKAPEAPTKMIEKPKIAETPKAETPVYFKERIDTPKISSQGPEAPIVDRVTEPVSATPIKKKAAKKDLEKFIGENLINKIGIAVLVLGISFFVKYAIDKNWINESGRVLIGLACGTILIGIAHYIRKSYRSFSSVLIGGGLTVFYFSVAFAFHQYQLIGQQLSFAAMVIITTFAVFLSVIYDRKELAILAAIGGFVTPFLVSTGNENYIALFVYLCILNTGMMALSWFKRWHAINIISLFFTTIIYGGWLVRWFIFKDASLFPYKDAIAFATAFYFIFIAMNILNNLRLGRKFSGFDFMIVLGTNFLYFTSGMLALEMWSEGKYQGAFTAFIGIFNLALTFSFYNKKKIDPNFVSLLLGLSLTFISLAAPIQFRGNHVTMFWAAESVLLLWLFNKTKIQQLRIASMAMICLMLFSLLTTWFNYYLADSDVITIVFNRPFITSVSVIIALYIYYRLNNGEEKANVKMNAIDLKKINLFLVFMVAYVSGILEIYYQFNSRYPDLGIYTIYLELYSFIFVTATFWILRKSDSLPLLKFILTVLSLVLYLVNIQVNYELSKQLIQTGPASLFMGHWLFAGLLGWLSYDMIVFFFKKRNETWNEYLPHLGWLASLSIILLLSVELSQILFWTSYEDPKEWSWLENLYYRAGLSIIWGVCSFVMMWIGMRVGFKTLRIVSLSVFMVTLIKLFFYDIRNVPPGGKIAAFILLGILLLTVSFMYQRLKKMIIDNPTD